MTKRISILTLAFLAGPLWADQGTTADTFLKLNTSPRALAMGDAYTGISDDVSAIQYNTAGMAFMQQKELTLSHNIWFLDMFYDYGALVWPLANLGTVGLNFFYLNGGTFDGYDQSFTPTGQFTASSMYASLAYSRKILSFLSAGLDIKMLSESIAGSSASGVAVDLGAMYKSQIPGLTFGMNVANLGPSVGFNEAFSLPLVARFGLGYKPQDNVVIGFDYTQPVETVGVMSLGGEYGYRDTLFVRLGLRYQGAVDYNQTYSGYGPSVMDMLKMGLGIKLYKMYYANYAYEPHGFLGTGHHFDLTVKFK